MLPEQQQRIMGYFIEEAKDNLNTIEQGLLNLQSTIEDPEMANEVFRAAHSVKGGAAMLGIESVQRTAHRMEDYFKILKESPIKTDRDLESMFLQVFDAMQELVEQLQGPFGLTEDKAQEIMTGVEPVFGRLNDHLETLVQSANIEQPTAPIAPAIRQEPVTYAEGSALQLVFKSDVSGCLREMLTIFKQDDSDLNRSNLQAICQRLKQLGEQFELTAWNDLIETARLAIGNHNQSYRTLAPVLIKDIKKAQDLVLANRAPEVIVSEAMQSLLPEDVVSAVGAMDDLFADSSSLDNGETERAEFDDLFTAESASGEADLFEVDLFESSADTSDAVPEFDLASDLFGDTTPIADTLDLDLEGIEAVSSLEGSSSTTDESLDFLLDNTSGPMGPEVGDAELNSLADLFEGDLSDLDDSWQDEEIGPDVSALSSSPADIDITDDDFADLLESSSDSLELGVPDNPGDEMADLFGDMLSEDSIDSTDIAVGSADLVGDFENGTPLDDALNELAASEAVEESDLLNDDLLHDLEPTLPIPDLSSNALGEEFSESLFATDVDDGPDSISALNDISSTDLGETLDSDDINAQLSAIDNPSDLDETSDTDGFEFEFSQPDAVTKIEPDTAFGDLDINFDSEIPADTSVDTLASDLESGFGDLDPGSDGSEIGEPAVFETDFDDLGLDFGDDAAASPVASLNDLNDELSLDFGDAASSREEASLDDLDLAFGDASASPDANPRDLSNELDLDFGDSASEASFGEEASLDDLDFGFGDASASEASLDELGLGFGDDPSASPDDNREDLSEDLSNDLDLDFDGGASETFLDDGASLGELDLGFSNEIPSSPNPLAENPPIEVPLAGADNFFDELPSADLPDSPDDSDEIDSFFETPENLEVLSPPSSVTPDLDLTQDPWDDSAIATADVSSDLGDVFDVEETPPPTDLDAALDLPNADGADLAFSDLEMGEVDTHEAALGDLFEASSPATASIDEAPAADLEIDLSDNLFEAPPIASASDLDFPQDPPGDLAGEALEFSTDLMDEVLNTSSPETPVAETPVDLGVESPEGILEGLDLEGIGGLDGFGNDDFEDLDALLDADAVLESNVLEGNSLEGNAQEDSDLEGNDAENAPETEDIPVADNEFQDLERLLEEADQTLGGPTGASTTRRIVPSVNRLASRRGAGILGEQTMRVSVNHLDNLSNLVGELVVNRNTLEQDQERLRQFLDNLLFQVQQLNDVGQRMRDLYERSLLESSLISSRQAYSTAKAGHPEIASQDDHATGETFDALEMDRFTGFHTLSQEMIELIVRVRESSSDIAYTVESSDQVTRQFRQVTTQLQEGLNKARMVPFAQTADRLPRAVRDISVKCGKESGLVVEGRDTLIDKMILEQLYNPMTHLVNNAITHGVETPQQRQAAGKSREGTITVRAFYQGNQTVIYVADDGGGIDPDLVKRKAVEKGLITQAEAKSMSVLDVYELLFHPGFSTRDQADDFAGRGVGMDVVRTSLAEIRGSITIDSELGKGTSFTIRLPLTLSISKALSCISNQARIAFPMDGVEDMLDVPQERVRTNDQGEQCILWRDTMLAFQKLSDLLKFNRTLGRGRVYGGQVDDDVISIVVLRSASTYIALEVDQVIGEQEIVIKQLEGPVPKPVGIAGATVLGDGRVMPIADVLELIDIAMGRVRHDPSTALWTQAAVPVIEEPAATKSEPTVLIVDDSITVRELLSMSFNKVGYRVEQARDGQEAWEKLKSGLPCDLVFCDIEMPRMDGLELLSRMQKDGSLKRIPIAMLTSRGADRHRQMAVDLGASGYFTKPYLEEALLDAANKMLNGERIE